MGDRHLGVVVKSSADRTKRLGLLLVVPACCLVGLIPALGQANRSLPTGTAVSSSTQPLTASGDKSDDSFIIGNEDVLAINVWKEADLTRSVQVRSDGKISLPLMGEVQAAGRTPLQLEQEIATKLQDYIAKPRVTVMVEHIYSKKFNILGQVAKPGSYSLALAPTVMDAIATAGGLRDFAKQKSIYVIRQSPNGNESHISFNYKEFIKGRSPDQNIRLEPNDTVIVP